MCNKCGKDHYTKHCPQLKKPKAEAKAVAKAVTAQNANQLKNRYFMSIHDSLSVTELSINFFVQMKAVVKRHATPS